VGTCAVVLAAAMAEAIATAKWQAMCAVLKFVPLTPTLSPLLRGEGDCKPALAPFHGERDGVRG
jgi:hypothetical protein